MRKVIFFPGIGTAYSLSKEQKNSIDIYPETVPALRFLSRRGYEFVLITSDYSEFRKFRTALKDKNIPLFNLNLEKTSLPLFAQRHTISCAESVLITDGLYLKQFLERQFRIILVLSGNGVCTLSALNGNTDEQLADICKNIYAAAFSIALYN